eukprot:c22048_g1_i4 orf=613-2301(+)
MDIVEPNAKDKRKAVEILDFIKNDLLSCKYLKVAVEKSQPVNNSCHLPCSEGLCRRVLVRQDALNFQKSGVPLRFMYYDKGQWRDYTEDVIPTILENFIAQKGSAKFSVNGRVYVVNFVYMIQLNLSTGFARSIAWIDRNGHRFTPSKCMEGSCTGLLSRLQSPDLQLAVEDDSVEAKLANFFSYDPSRVLDNSCNDFARLGDKVIKLSEDYQDFTFAKDKFLSGLSLFAKDVTITRIHRNSHTSISGQTRLQAFRIQERITAEVRGDANVRYAWHGTSKEGVSGIILHGFGQPRVPKNGDAYGVGVYLAPEDSSHVSAVYSDVDENGEQHIVLCKVIMGRMEQVQAGSQQFHPSNEDYDTGVDDAKRPKRYIVWSTHMNTHILPLFIISFKLAALSRDVMIAAQRGKQALKECVAFTRHSAWDDQAINKASVLAKACVAPVVHPRDNHFEEACQSAEYCSPDKQADSCTSGVSEACDYKTASPCTSRCKETTDTSSNGPSHRNVPRSPWISFPELFPLLEAKLEPQAMNVLQQLHVKFQVSYEYILSFFGASIFLLLHGFW